MSNSVLLASMSTRFDEIVSEHMDQVMAEVIESHYGMAFESMCEVLRESSGPLVVCVQEAIYEEHRAEATNLAEDIAKEILIEELEDLIRGL